MQSAVEVLATLLAVGALRPASDPTERWVVVQAGDSDTAATVAATLDALLDGSVTVVPNGGTAPQVRSLASALLECLASAPDVRPA